VVLAPRSEPPEAIPGVQAMPFAGAPYIATGNPMIDGLGPAAYAMRSDHPELAYDDGLPKIVPLRAAADFYLAYEDTDPRGFAVLGADGIIAGTIVDTWIDRSEYIARFLELELDPAIGIGRRILPLSYAQIRAKEGAIKVKAILGAQFADVPVLRDPDTVTPREEDRITAYYASGFLYATALRAAPLL
jgi:photosynthetic reaction center H subunit